MFRKRISAGMHAIGVGRSLRWALVLCMLSAPLAVLAQQGSSNNASSPGQQQQPAAQQNQTPPEDGGPNNDTGVMAIPKKTQPEETAPPPPPPPPVKNPPELQNYSLRVDVPVVNVDVSVVLDKNKQFVRGLKPDNFRVYEDGVEQKISSVKVTQTPITAVMLLEFAANSWYFINDMQEASYYFLQQLRPDDYIAVVTYDMRTQILTDFTKNKQVVAQALNSLQIPGFSETNLFDALYQTLDRLSRIQGRKYIILISSGRDTFSKINLDQILAKIKATPNVTIYSIGTGQYVREMADASGMMGPVTRMDYLQADNQLNTFSRMTGGRAFFPMLEGQLPDIFHEINDSIRNEYIVSYRPSNTRMDGTYRKLKVMLVDNEGKPLKMQDEKHHNLKYDVIARDGYKAAPEVQ
ncbi:MAG: VWA domain-containing protein [Acidobacteriaceae bacterium]